MSLEKTGGHPCFLKLLCADYVNLQSLKAFNPWALTSFGNVAWYQNTAGHGLYS